MSTSIHGDCDVGDSGINTSQSFMDKQQAMSTPINPTCANISKHTPDGPCGSVFPITKKPVRNTSVQTDVFTHEVQLQTDQLPYKIQTSSVQCPSVKKRYTQTDKLSIKHNNTRTGRKMSKDFDCQFAYTPSVQDATVFTEQWMGQDKGMATDPVMNRHMQTVMIKKKDRGTGLTYTETATQCHGTQCSTLPCQTDENDKLNFSDDEPEQENDSDSDSEYEKSEIEKQLDQLMLAVSVVSTHLKSGAT